MFFFPILSFFPNPKNRTRQLLVECRHKEFDERMRKEKKKLKKQEQTSRSYVSFGNNEGEGFL
jgi:hypothetical protein